MKEFTGKKFGKLTIISVERKRGQNKNLAHCKCDCGNLKSANLYAVTSKHTTSCGCAMYQYQPGINSYKFKGYGEILGRRWSGIKHGAELRGIPFNISIEYAWNRFLKQDRRCPYTGEVLLLKRTTYDSDHDNSSLDRIDSSKGYIEGNVQWVLKSINEMKWDLGSDRFIELCNLISNPIKHNIINESCNVVKHYGGFEGVGNLGLRLWHRILKNAKDRNISVEMTINDAWNLFVKQNGYCALTGLPLHFNSCNDISASLDRIDYTKEYTIDNVQWVHKDINYKLKKHYSESLLKEICLKVTNYSKA